MMTTYNVLIEGQTMTLPPGIEKDEDIRRALEPYFPEVKTALLNRKEEGDVVTVTIVKKAGSKGTGPLAKLSKCPGGKNPAIALYEEIDALGASADIVALLEYESRIDQALEEGEKQRNAIRTALSRLVDSVAQPAPVVVVGF
jgi:hypothetical protein